MQTIDPSKFLLYDWDVRWGTFNFGGVDNVEPDLELMTVDKKCGSTGAMVLGHWVRGISGLIRVEARQIDHAVFETILAWNGGSVTASVPLVPTDANGAPKDLYDYAKTLILHPSHLPSNTTTLDFTFLKAVPLLPKAPADGETPNVIPIDFIIYPDRAQLPQMVYGWLGPAV